MTDAPLLAEAFRYCEQRVREADKDRFLASLFAPADRRPALFALYAFDLEIGEVRERISTPLPGEVRLQWWRDALTGTSAGDAGGSPVAAALLATVRRFSLPVPVLLDHLDAHTFDLYDDPLPSLAEFERYAVATAGGILRLAAMVLNGGTAPSLEAAVRHAAIAVVLAAVLQRLPRHAARGQRVLPVDVLGRHGASSADLFAGQATPSLLAALAELRGIARAHLAGMPAALAALPARLLPAFLPLAVIPGLLARMESRRYDPFRPPQIAQWRRQWTLWRAARHPERFIR